MSWRTVALVLGALLLWQTWRGCTRGAPRPAPASRAADCASARPGALASARRDDAGEDRGGDRAASGGRSGDGFHLYGFRVQVPGWAWAMLPQPGEGLRAYRDRMVPLARAAIAPHRARVARGRDDLAQQLGLDARQRGELDAAARDAAQAIQARVLGAALSGDFLPATFKPMSGVALGREVLELVDDAHKRFTGALTEGQRDQLAEHPFDFADYLLFSTPWEDALRAL